MQKLIRDDGDRKFLLFDVESESLNGYYNKPWQLSYLVCKGKNILKFHDTFPLWDDLKVSPDAARVTRFDMVEYKRKATNAKEIWNNFSQYLYDPEYTILGHNLLGFDIFLINIYRRLLGLKPDWSYQYRIIDTLAMAKFLKYSNPARKEEDLYLWQMKLISNWEKGPKCSLGAMAKEFDIPYDSNLAHDGLYDCDVNFQVFKQMMYRIEL